MSTPNLQTALPITALLSDLRKRTDDPLPSYEMLWRLCVGSRLPAHQSNRRWFVDAADIPVIMATLGLRPKDKAACKATSTTVAA